MSGSLDKLFHKQTAVSECSLSLRERSAEGFLDLLQFVDSSDSTTSSSISSLQNDRGTVLLGELDSFLSGSDRTRSSGDDLDTGFYGGLTGSDLVSHSGHYVGAGADEHNAGVLACGGEVGALREESVSRMDSVNVVLNRSILMLAHNHCKYLESRLNDLIDCEIGCNWREALSDEVGFIGFQAMHRVLVLLCINRH